MPNVPVLYPSEGKLQKHTSSGYMRDLVGPGAFDQDMFEDKFWGDALRTLYPAAKTSNGTVTFTEHNANGYLELKSGSGNDDYAGQGLGLQFTGDRGVLAEFVIKTPATITAWKWECGLTDADDDAGAVNQKATTSTATATDFAVFVVDTDDDANIAFVSAKAGTVVEQQDIIALEASTTYRLAIRVEDDTVQAWINGDAVLNSAQAIEGGNALTPWVFSQARSANERILQLHKWRATQPAW